MAGQSVLADNGLIKRSWRGIWTSYKASGAFIVCLILALAVIMASWLAPQNPYNLAEIDFFDARLAPMSQSQDGMIYWLGTDAQGRDMLSAMLYGLRISVGVGFSAGLIALIVGSFLGIVAAYVGGRLDAFLMRLVDLMLGFPTILVALLILALTGQGVIKVVIALIIVQWAYFARTARAAALVEVNKDYIEAARCLGLGPLRIMFSHMLPNCLPPLIVISTIQIANAIAAEATLSFLGIGLPITEPSLGLLISNGYQVLIAGLYWMSVFPGLLLLVLVFSINIVGDRLREVLNPRLAQS